MGGFSQTERLASIPIFDDDVDEATYQIFIVHLVLVNAVNPGLLNIAESSSECQIVDNDRE